MRDMTADDGGNPRQWPKADKAEQGKDETPDCTGRGSGDLILGLIYGCRSRGHGGYPQGTLASRTLNGFAAMFQVRLKGLLTMYAIEFDVCHLNASLPHPI